MARILEHTVKAVAISHDGARLLTGSMDGTAQVWDAATLKPVGLPLQHSGQVYAAAACHCLLAQLERRFANSHSASKQWHMIG